MLFSKSIFFFLFYALCTKLSTRSKNILYLYINIARWENDLKLLLKYLEKEKKSLQGKFEK